MRPFAIVILLCSTAIILAAQNNSTQIAVVDLNTIFESHPRKTKIEADLGKLQDSYAEQLSQLDKKVAKLTDEIAMLVPNTSEYSAAKKRLFSAIQDRKFEINKAAEDFTIKKQQFHKKLLQSLDQDIQAFAKAKGYQLILQREFKVSEGRSSWQSVLYASQAVDITQQLVESLKE